MLEQQNLLHCQNLGAPSVKKAMHSRGSYSEADKEAKVRASWHTPGSEKATGVPPCKVQLLFILSSDSRVDGDAGVRDGEEEGGRREDSGSLGEADEMD